MRRSSRAGNRGTPRWRPRGSPEQEAFSRGHGFARRLQMVTRANGRRRVSGLPAFPFVAKDLAEPTVVPFPAAEALLAARADGAVAVTFERLAAPGLLHLHLRHELFPGPLSGPP